MDYLWNYNWQGKTEYLWEKLIPVPHCPLQIPREFLGSNPRFCVEEMAPNCLRCDM